MTPEGATSGLIFGRLVRGRSVITHLAARFLTVSSIVALYVTLRVASTSTGKSGAGEYVP